MNQRLLIAVVLGTIFLAIFVATTLVLSTLMVPDERTTPRAASGDDPAASPVGLQRPKDYLDGRGVPDAWTADERAGGAFGGHAFQQPAAPTQLWLDPAMRQWGEPDAPPMRASAPGDYRFRPLDERERERLYRQGEIPFEWTGRLDRDPAQSAFSPADRQPDGLSFDWGAAPYRFRPPDPPRSGPAQPGAKQPGARPGPHAPRGFVDPRLFEPVPQWGASPLDGLPGLPPSAPELYPSLTPSNPNRLTIR